MTNTVVMVAPVAASMIDLLSSD